MPHFVVPYSCMFTVFSIFSSVNHALINTLQLRTCMLLIPCSQCIAILGMKMLHQKTSAILLKLQMFNYFYWGRYAHTSTWKSEGNLQKGVLSFTTWPPRFELCALLTGGQHLYPLSSCRVSRYFSESQKISSVFLYCFYLEVRFSFKYEIVYKQSLRLTVKLSVFN